MRLRLAVWVWAALGAVGLIGCAEGSPAEPVNRIEPPPPVMEPTCGNGKLDPPAEQCECPNKMTTGQCKVDGMTCADVGMGTGTLLCNAAPMCTFNFTMCTGGKSTGGTGAGGTGSR